jgi:hypothetical protein
VMTRALVAARFFSGNHEHAGPPPHLTGPLVGSDGAGIGKGLVVRLGTCTYETFLHTSDAGAQILHVSRLPSIVASWGVGRKGRITSVGPWNS